MYLKISMSKIYEFESSSVLKSHSLITNHWKIKNFDIFNIFSESLKYFHDEGQTLYFCLFRLNNIFVINAFISIRVRSYLCDPF